MKKKTLNTKQGFTIIEVVLVLAIAGLIFLMVFVAFPALQRNQRDTQRRQDYADLSAAIISAATNNNGNFPSTTAKSSLEDSIGKNGVDPEGTEYEITQLGEMSSQVDSTISKGKIKVYKKATCGGNSGIPTKGGSDVTEKQFVIFGYLESGMYCLEGKI